MVNADIRIAEGPTFASRLRRFAGNTAIVTDDGQRLSYEVLADHVDRFAERLGDERRLVLIGAANSLEAVIAYLQVLGIHRSALTAAPTAQTPTAADTEVAQAKPAAAAQ